MDVYLYTESHMYLLKSAQAALNPNHSKQQSGESREASNDNRQQSVSVENETEADADADADAVAVSVSVTVACIYIWTSEPHTLSTNAMAGCEWKVEIYPYKQIHYIYIYPEVVNCQRIYHDYNA